MRFVSLGVATVGLAIATPAFAQAPPPDFQRQLEERDAIINDLLRRVETLEQQVQQQTPPQSGPVAPPPGAAARRPPTAAPRTTESDETIARALERSLLEQGGQVLPVGTFEAAPEIQYSHTSTGSTAILNTTTAGTVTTVTTTNLTTRRDVLEAGAIFRYGLPWDSQVNLHIPYVTSWSEATVLGSTSSRTDSGIGDIDFGLSKQFLYDHGWVPDAIAQVQYKTSTGSASFTSGQFTGGTGSSFDSVLGGLTLVKRQDPLVFLGGASYTHVFSDRKGGIDVAPGDQIDVRAGTILAASPDTSLRFVFDTAFIERSSIGGNHVAGSDAVDSFFEVGASSVISASTFLDLGVDIGLTRDAPDFRVIFSAPIRF